MPRQQRLGSLAPSPRPSQMPPRQFPGRNCPSCCRRSQCQREQRRRHRDTPNHRRWRMHSAAASRRRHRRPGRQQPPRQSRVGAKQAESHADRPRLSAKAFLPGSHHALAALSILPQTRWPSCEAPPPSMLARGAATATQTGPRLTSGPPSIQRRCDGQPLPSPHHSTPRARARTAAGEHRDAGGQRLGSTARQGRRGGRRRGQHQSVPFFAFFHARSILVQGKYQRTAQIQQNRPAAAAGRTEWLRTAPPLRRCAAPTLSAGSVRFQRGTAELQQPQLRHQPAVDLHVCWAKR